MNIYVGNLPYQMTEEELVKTFQKFGEVSSAKIIKDWESGSSKGFGFVEMPVQTQAENAIKNMNGAELEGKNLKVNLAQMKSDRPKKPRRF
jgi:RNA recognition motif-containing protein